MRQVLFHARPGREECEIVCKGCPVSRVFSCRLRCSCPVEGPPRARRDEESSPCIRAAYVIINTMLHHRERLVQHSPYRWPLAESQVRAKQSASRNVSVCASKMVFE